MTGLWLVATALLLLALLLVLPPLLQAPEPADTDTERRRVQLAQRGELQQDVASATLLAGDSVQADDELLRGVLAATPLARAPAPRWLGPAAAGVLAVAVPIAALALYLQAGDPRAAMEENQPAAAHAEGGLDLQARVVALAERLRQQPADLGGWVMLARSWEHLGRYDEAATAWARAVALAPRDAQLLAEYADALASAHGGELGGAAQEAITAALALDPDHPKALALAGAAAFRRGDAELARRHWQRLLPLLPPGSDVARRIESGLARLD